MTTSNSFDDYLRGVLATIDRCGWSIQGVNGGGCDCCGGGSAAEPTLPPFAYTVGLTPRSLPELLFVGGLGAEVLNGFAERLVRDGSIPAGRYVETPFNDYDFVVMPAGHPSSPATMS